MTASPCHDLAAYLDGRLSDDEEAAFEAHLADCDTCVDTADDDLALAFRQLSDVACPPAIVDRALAEARRRAPDRAPALALSRSRRGRVRALIPLALVALAAAVWFAQPTDAPATDPLATRVEESPETPPVPADGPVDESDTPSPAPPSPAPDRSTAPSPAPPARSTPTPTASTPAPSIDPAPSPENLAQSPAADSVQVARDELLYAFAIVADAQDHAANAVADGVGRVSDAIRSTPPLASPR